MSGTLLFNVNNSVNRYAICVSLSKTILATKNFVEKLSEYKSYIQKFDENIKEVLKKATIFTEHKAIIEKEEKHIESAIAEASEQNKWRGHAPLDKITKINKKVKSQYETINLEKAQSLVIKYEKTNLNFIDKLEFDNNIFDPLLHDAKFYKTITIEELYVIKQQIDIIKHPHTEYMKYYFPFTSEELRALQKKINYCEAIYDKYNHFNVCNKCEYLDTAINRCPDKQYTLGCIYIKDYFWELTRYISLYQDNLIEFNSFYKKHQDACQEYTKSIDALIAAAQVNKASYESLANDVLHALSFD